MIIAGLTLARPGLGQSPGVAEENAVSVVVVLAPVDEPLEKRIADWAADVLGRSGLKPGRIGKAEACDAAPTDRPCLLIRCETRDRSVRIRAEVRRPGKPEWNLEREKLFATPDEILAEVWDLSALAASRLGGNPAAELKVAVAGAPARVVVDSVDLGLAPILVRVPPGLHHVEALAPSRDETCEVEVRPDEIREITLGLETLPEETSLTRNQTWALALSGVTVAGILGGSLFMAFDGRCTRDEDPCTTWVSDLWPLAVASYGTAGLAAVAAVLLYVLDPEADKEEGERP